MRVKHPYIYYALYIERKFCQHSSEIVDLKLDASSITPEFVLTEEECTDTSKIYVLPDGYLYANTTVTEMVEKYQNAAKPDSAEWLTGTRLGSSGLSTSDATNHMTTNPIYCKTGDKIYIKNAVFTNNNTYIVFTNENNTWRRSELLSNVLSNGVDSTGYFGYEKDTVTGADVFTVLTTLTGTTYVRLCLTISNNPNYKDIIISVNNPILPPEETTIEKWLNTGIKFIGMDTNDLVVQDIIREEAKNQLSSIQLTPEYANDISECVDTTKMYVLPDGFIYSYQYVEATSEVLYTDLAAPDITNTTDKTKWINDYRISSSGLDNTSSNTGKTVCNPICRKDGSPLQTGDIIRIKGISFIKGVDRAGIYKVNGTAQLHAQYVSSLPDSQIGYELKDDVHTFTILSTYAELGCFRCAFSTPTNPDDVIITVNEEIVETTGSSGYAWTNTGHAFVPADYEPVITELADDIQSLQDDVAKIEEQIEQGISNAASYNIPTHWQEAIKSASERIKAARDPGGVNCVNFLWTTDIHAIEEKPSTLAFTTNKTMDEVGKLFGHIAKTMMDKADIPLFVATGDLMSQNSYTDTAKVYSELALIKKWLDPIPYCQQALTMGNHDGAWGNTSASEDQYKNQLPLNEMYNLIYRKQDMDFRRVSGDNGTYYYIDNISQKMRFIVLNTNNTPDYEALSDGKAKYNRFSGCCCQAQLDWLTNIALNMPDGYTACILGHEPYPSDWVQMVGIVDAYNKKVSFKNTYTHSEDTWRNSTIDVNFANAKGEIAAVFAGHVHYDYIRNNENNPMYSTCPLILMTTSLGGRTDRTLPDGATQPSRSEDNATEFAMDIVTVDTANRKIYTTRLGAGDDRMVSY